MAGSPTVLMPLLKLVTKVTLLSCVITIMERPLLSLAFDGINEPSSPREGCCAAIVLPVDSAFVDAAVSTRMLVPW